MNSLHIENPAISVNNPMLPEEDCEANENEFGYSFQSEWDHIPTTDECDRCHAKSRKWYRKAGVMLDKNKDPEKMNELRIKADKFSVKEKQGAVLIQQVKKVEKDLVYAEKEFKRLYTLGDKLDKFDKLPTTNCLFDGHKLTFAQLKDVAIPKIMRKLKLIQNGVIFPPITPTGGHNETSGYFVERFMQ